MRFFFFFIVVYVYVVPQKAILD